MNKRVLVWSAVLLIAAGVAGARTLLAQNEKKAGTSGHARKVVFAAPDKATYKPGPGDKVSMATIWGDPDKGAHGTFTKFDPGFDAGMHTHTNDVWIVGIKGAYLYKDEAGEKRVGPGDFLRIPGGHKHWSGGDKTEGALFYEEGSAKFDNVPAQ